MAMQGLSAPEALDVARASFKVKSRADSRMRADLAVQARRIAACDPRSGRLRSAGDLVARMRPRFGEVGITRLAEITGLDRVGWPVWAAVRPNAATLSVCQGKGATAEAAQASAVMEAAEISFAEQVTTQRTGSTADLCASQAAFDLLPALVRRGHSVPREEQVIGWLEGHDVMRERAVWVPCQAVQINSTVPDRIYWQSSDGLGSGSLLIEAVLHGLYERIERDAGELWHLRSDEEVADACVDPHALGSAEVSRLADAIARAALHLRLFDIASDVGVPVYFATVSPVPNGRERNWCHFDLASGMGCRLDPAGAALAAIGEAVQSRLTTISGARDDFQPDVYSQPIASDILIYPRCRPADPDAMPAPRAASAPAAVPIEDALDVVLARLDAAGVHSVIVVPLHEDADFAVAKVLVTDLEYPPGARARPHGRRLQHAMSGRR